MVSQALAELRLRNSSNLVMADTFTEVHRKDGLVCAVGDAAAVSVECAGVDGLEVWETLMDGEFATPVDGRAERETGTASSTSAWATSSCALRRLPPPGDTAYR